ncbi:MAG: signal transduction histidine kinase [Paracoccaceae bacterium]|jgi:signal transduction histidine kinase
MPYRFGIAMILIAAFALGIMAWRGLANHRELVWSEARDEAELVAERFQERLEREVRQIHFYDYPPAPGSFDFDAKASLDELREQMTLDKRTTAGLPVAVLAAYEVAKRSGSVRDGELARDLALKRWPDLTSPLILERLEKLAEEHRWEGNFSDWQDDWDTEEAARDLIRETDGLGWMEKEGRLHRVEELGEGSFSHIVLSNDSSRWRDGRNYGVELRTVDFSLGEVGKVLWKRTLGNATFSVGILDSEALEAEWRSRKNGTLLILGFAALVIGAGTWMMTRGILLEKKNSHAKSQFVASVTHELRAPVGAMRLMADSLQSGKLAKDKVAEFHGLMARESGRLSVLIENVMDLARVEDGQRVLRAEEVQLEEIAAEVCEMMTMQAKDKGITFAQAGSPLTVSADPVALRQILVNLVDNAIKFSPAGSEVTLDWGEGWWVSVRDQGSGIDEADRTRIFERFYRGEDELRRKTKGVGIGLSLVKELVDLQGGKVSVSNKNGAVFKVVFLKR